MIKGIVRRMELQKINLLIVTTSRADYGLLYPLIKKIYSDNFFNPKLLVTGAHLSSFYGMTISKIIEDGFSIDYQVEMTQEGDAEKDVCNSIAIGLKGFSNIFSREDIDLIIVLGDRYELLAVCIAALINKIPIAHIHGGETTYGVIDDTIRHSITKMSSIHFPSIDLYAKRIIQMGENPERVFVVGALGVDNVYQIELMTKEQLSKFVEIDFDKNVALMTYHPVTLDEYDSAGKQVIEILEALMETNLFVLITMPNADTGGRQIYEIITRYTVKYPGKFKLVKNLGQKAYLSAMKFSKLMIGNSSSGIIESASFKLPVVNIGDRQKGRYKPINVIDTDCSKRSILKAINVALSPEFIKSIKDLSNPYGDGNAADRIINVLKSTDLTNKSKLLKKGFYDLDFKPYA
jgi:UDP-hydrolysing UDP-N-acetyl-D-glucosamine 2-epimerase